MASGYTPGLLRTSHGHETPNDIRKTHTHTNHGKDRTSMAQIQNVKSSRVYVFGEGNLAEDDEEITEFEMRSRHHKNTVHAPKEDPRPIYFEKEISEGDTLQAIALKYACNVSELKRLNNLIRDQEFYALKVVKVPMTRHGILSEKVAQNELEAGETASNSRKLNGTTSFIETDDDDRDVYGDSESQHDFSDPETQMKVLRTLSIRENFSSQGREAEKFLRKMDADLIRLKNLPRSERESLTEVISVLTNKSIHPLSSSSKGNSRFNGADCGFSWRTILIVTLGIAILVPLLYLTYLLVLKS